MISELTPTLGSYYLAKAAATGNLSSGFPVTNGHSYVLDSVSYAALSSGDTSTYLTSISAVGANAVTPAYVRAVNGRVGPWAQLQLSDVFQQVYSVYDYGAKGDGATDDTTALNAAITAANLTGGVVQLGAKSYLINSSATLALATAGVTIRGCGSEATKILIGSSFTGAAAVVISANNCGVRDLSINGASSTTTSNPVADAIQVNGCRRTKIDGCNFWYVNGWAIEALAGTTSTTNEDGTMISRCHIRSSAAGIHFKGNTNSGWATNSFVTDVQIISGGVTTGGSANLDGIMVEDSWDVLFENVMTWTSVGTGHSFHIKGNCAATFVRNLDALGPNTAECVLIEDGTNGSPQNIQIDGGVIQQGTIGLNITGGANQVRIHGTRFISNQTHGVQVAGTGNPIHLTDVTFNQNGAAATGTNYDINWSGSSIGSVLNPSFNSSITSTGVAGVQTSVNVTANQDVRFISASFKGTGAARANWFTNWPGGVLMSNGGPLEFPTATNFTSSTSTSVAITGQVTGQRLLGSTGSDTTSISLAVGISADTFDRYRLTSDGTVKIGTGSASRDTSWGRTNTAQIGSVDSDIATTLAGKGFRVKEGTNAKMGTATLASGSSVVSNTSVTSTSRIVLTSNADGGTPGWLRVSARTAGTSFTITSSSGTDASTVAWIMYEPA